MSYNIILGTTMAEIITYLKKEAKRFLPLLLVASLILLPDPGSFVILYSLGINLLVAGVSHLIRKILFPYIDLKQFADKALETPLSAAIVFCGVVLILAVMITTTCVLLH